MVELPIRISAFDHSIFNAVSARFNAACPLCIRSLEVHDVADYHTRHTELVFDKLKVPHRNNRKVPHLWYPHYGEEVEEMVRLIQKQEILLAYLHEGLSQREIARRTGINRKTIRKYIREYVQQREELAATEDATRMGVLTEGIVQSPKYPVRERPKPVVTEAVEQKIRDFLTENVERRNKGMHKQVRRPVDIHSELESLGTRISYGSVLRTIRTLESKTREAYIKSDYLPGDVCEFDWGEVKLEIAGEIQKFQMAVFASAYGNYRFAWLFHKQKSECFQEAHARFFEHIGGVYQQMVYDNMRVAVKKLAGSEKEPTDALLQLSLYYGFQYRFCNIRSGNEKGHEKRVVM